MHTEAHFAWDDRYLVGHPTVDQEHREFVTLVHALQVAGDEQLPAAMARFAAHAAAHFALEEALMAEHDFPAGECHRDEHARVMVSVREVASLVTAGHLEIARELAQALIDWFPGHSDYMDSALATWVAKRTSGGAPLVLRRAPSPAATVVHPRRAGQS